MPVASGSGRRWHCVDHEGYAMLGGVTVSAKLILGVQDRLRDRRDESLGGLDQAKLGGLIVVEAHRYDIPQTETAAKRLSLAAESAIGIPRTYYYVLSFGTCSIVLGSAMNCRISCSVAPFWSRKAMRASALGLVTIGASGSPEWTTLSP